MTSATSSSGPSAGPGQLPESVYRTMANVLRGGLIVALLLLAGGMVVLLVQCPWSSSGGWIAPNPLVRYLDVRTLAAGLATGAPEAYLTLGVLALIATPVVRVITGMTAFFHQGESRMGLLSAAVLLLLLVGLFVVGPLVR